MERTEEIAGQEPDGPREWVDDRKRGANLREGVSTAGRIARIPPIFCTWQCATPLLLALLLHARGLSAAAPDLLDPLGPPAAPAVAFGELAPGVFHSGVDWAVGAESRPVAAGADGDVERVRISASGYGRALHLRLDDGREIVYAHLSVFSPALEESCRARQWAEGRYDLDWRPPRGSLRVARGEWLGRTGRTPDGRPLLHVEVRVAGLPENPFLHGFPPPQDRKPIITAIRFEPLGPAARIDGKLADKRVVFDAEGRPLGRASVERTVLWGPIGVYCETQERSGRPESHPWTMRLEVDGVVQYEGDLSGRDFPGRWNPEIRELDRAPRGVQRLFRPADRDRGRLACGSAIATGAHRLRVIARSVAGAADSVEALILVREAPRLLEWIGRPLGRGVWDLGVKIQPPQGEDPETMRLWIDLTENGADFPVRTPLAHMGDGWFLGEVASFKPSGRLGMRSRIQTKDGIETWEPTVGLEGSLRDCEGVPVGSPAVRVTPRWLEVRLAAPCMPNRPPDAALIRAFGEAPCALLEEPSEAGVPPEWRFVADARRGRGSGPPEIEVRIDGRRSRWLMPGLVNATPAHDLSWTSPDGALTLEIPAATFYAPVWISWSTAPREMERIGGEELEGAVRGAPSADEHLVARSAVHRFDPLDLEMDGVFRAAIRPGQPPASPEEARRLAIYGRSGPRAGWSWRGGLWTGSAVVAVVDRMEEWILLEDLTEPWLYGMDPGPGEQRSAPVESLLLQVREEGSGIDGGDIEVLLDGETVPAAWNASTRQVRIEPREPLGRGAHRWSVRIRDRAGNVAERQADFNIWAQEP